MTPERWQSLFLLVVMLIGFGFVFTLIWQAVLEAAGAL